MVVAVNCTVVLVPEGVVVADNDTPNGADVCTKSVVTPVPVLPLLSVADKTAVYVPPF